MPNLSAIFSKLIAIILFAVSFLIPGEADNMDISVTVSNTETQIITVEWKNNTGKAVTEPRFYIEKQNGEEWTDVPFAPGFGFPEIYTRYYPTEGGRITVDTARDLKEPLSQGTYRITLCYDVLYSENTNGNAHCIFVIK